ncbi:MAG: hypothetical protein ACP5SJ_01735 [Candidatus Micrarchaeia archaeon]
MRSSDEATLVRVLLAFIVAYMVIAKMLPWVTVVLVAIAFASDGIDGYLAVKEESKGKIGFTLYMRAATGDVNAKERVKPIKENISKHFPYGPRIDVAGDRVMEYTFWLLFLYTFFDKIGSIALFVVLLVVTRHAFADALMAAKGTSSKMKTRFAKAVYSSNTSRALINIVKFLAFAYLALFYALDYPAIIEYLLVAVLFAIIMLRGAAEIYESTKREEE